MNKDEFKGQWLQLKGKIKEKWGKLTDDEVTQIDGKYEQFVGTLQKKYGYAKERAEEEIKNWNLSHLATQGAHATKGSHGSQDRGSQGTKGSQDRGSQDRGSQDRGSQDRGSQGTKGSQGSSPHKK